MLFIVGICGGVIARLPVTRDCPLRRCSDLVFCRLAVRKGPRAQRRENDTGAGSGTHGVERMCAAARVVAKMARSGVGSQTQRAYCRNGPAVATTKMSALQRNLRDYVGAEAVDRASASAGPVGDQVVGSGDPAEHGEGVVDYLPAVARRCAGYGVSRYNHPESGLGGVTGGKGQRQIE